MANFRDRLASGILGGAMLLGGCANEPADPKIVAQMQTAIATAPADEKANYLIQTIDALIEERATKSVRQEWDQKLLALSEVISTQPEEIKTKINEHFFSIKEQLISNEPAESGRTTKAIRWDLEHQAIDTVVGRLGDSSELDFRKWAAFYPRKPRESAKNL